MHTNTQRRLAIALAVAAATGIAALGGSVSVASATAPPPMVTLMMGRAIEAQALDSNCQQIAPGAVRLATTAKFLSGLGLRATAPVTLSEIGETSPTCSSKVLYATWTELRSLRDSYGWDVVPRGKSNSTIVGETGQRLMDDTCNILPTFYNHGFPDAWGLFAYPQNRSDSTDQQTVETCYSFGRKYSGVGYTNKMPLSSPYWQRTLSVNGGLCNDSTLSCYNDRNVKNGRRYMLPAQLDNTVSSDSGSWTAVQFYRLVTGSQGSRTTAAGLPAWDCTSSDPRQHWSHLPEDYCYSDFQAFIKGLPSGVQDASPADVARAYGRTM